ncbi:hypothetical protein [Rhizobium sp. CCGE531]|uniref:hypothetical protein n=1 Tax=Rhizobium sp. CCGE531 TaxID=2364271 RepID=UPI000EA8B5DE|nr:hypothetical protein [Rhizobium sp. CCGE531]AYG66052.1 hypothetical protein CCGE531_08645 [Rhizobium sp. CCGE531]
MPEFERVNEASDWPITLNEYKALLLALTQDDVPVEKIRPIQILTGRSPRLIHNRYKELRRRGVPKLRAAVAAGSPSGFWHMSGHPAVQQTLRNHHFESLGLPRLYVSV